jgi:hypothetical protein
MDYFGIAWWSSDSVNSRRMTMRELKREECGLVAGAAACEYAGLDAMLSTSGAVGAVAGAAGFMLGGPAVAGIASAGTAAASLMSFGIYNFYMLSYDLFGGCTGYTGSC